MITLAARRAATLAAWLLALSASSGCVVTVYQPLLGLQRPTAIDPQLSNFEGTRLLLRCAQDEALDSGEASRLCKRLQSLFTKQGAEVETVTVRPSKAEDFGTPSRLANSAAPDLVIDVKARLTHEENSALWWILSVATLTLAPAYSEQSFAQDVSVKDASGFLLLSTSLQERFVRYTGFGVWALNGLLDWLVRAKEERVGGDVAKEQFSRDLYRQLTQLAFNARMRALVLHEFEAAAAPPPKAKGPGP